MEKLQFSHLHVHTEYSLLDGSSKINELILRTKELGMNSIAITDHGSMFGVIDFYKKAKQEGIKPIIGCETYVASNSRLDKSHNKNNYTNHLVLLAKNNKGYNNLIKLVSKAHLEGFYYRPRIDMELLKEHKEGLIALSACLGGPICKSYFKFSYEKALEEAYKYKEIFEDDFYIELQDHGLKEQKQINPILIKISKEANIPLVCTNDIHYVYEDDAKSHEILLCIQTRKTILDENRLTYDGGQFYLKSKEEMYELFKENKEAVLNTQKIADKCNVEIVFNEYKLPKFKIPNDENPFEYLKNLVYKNINKKYIVLTNEIRDRVEYELNTINEMGFVEYFLIVQDFINFARNNEIPVGPGRGSAAGSIVSYALNITTIDPLKYGLIFERFLNSERVSMPDIDIDFCYEKRQDVIDYVIKKYGSEKVVQIITFGTMAARAVIRDVGRALAMPYSQVDEIAKMIPMELGITIEKALKLNIDLKNKYDSDEEIKNLLNMSMRLEGLPRHSSTHAAGVVITDKDAMDYVPLSQNDGVVTTQYNMNTLEELGLLKMDFLGLRTLTVIQNVVNEVKRTKNFDIDIDNLPLDDKNIYDMISKAKTEGIFQLESSGMKQFLKELKPENFEEIIAGISLYRPGPMDFIPKYIEGKKNKNNIKYDNEKLKEILESTYGCIVYQEQVMQIVRDLGGYSLGRSDILRRAMSKKKSSVMEEERKNFVYGNDEIKGCIKNGYDEKLANKIYDDMIDFAKYAFNKSHAAAYALIGYQTAYLKYYYKVEFMCALLTSVRDNSTKIAEYIYECKQMNIEILPPCINNSMEIFSVENNKIRFALKSIKNVGQNICEKIVQNRIEKGSYKNIYDFCERLQSRDLDKRSLESLILSGSFDTWGAFRSQLMNVYEKILNDLNIQKKKIIDGQISFFDISPNLQKSEEKNLPKIDEYNKKQLLAFEKEVLGLYLSGSPLDEFINIINMNRTITSKDFIIEEDNLNIRDGQFCIYSGIINDKKIIYTKKNQRMAFITVEDEIGTIEVIVFPNVFERYIEKIDVDKIVLISGNVSLKENEAKLICNNIKILESASEEEQVNEQKFWIRINNHQSNNDFNKILKLLKQNSGSTPVVVYNKDKKEQRLLNYKYNVNVTENLYNDLKSIIGMENMKFK